jgi:hypothetical protein
LAMFQFPLATSVLILLVFRLYFSSLRRHMDSFDSFARTVPDYELRETPRNPCIPEGKAARSPLSDVGKMQTAKYGL